MGVNINLAKTNFIINCRGHDASSEAELTFKNKPIKIEINLILGAWFSEV